MQERKIKKELLKLQEMYNIFSDNKKDSFSDINLIFEAKFKKCNKHHGIKYFFCDNHREAGIMCNDCSENHIKDIKEQISQADIDNHHLFYFPFYLIKTIEENIVHVMTRNKDRVKISRICDAISNYKSFLDYNYYFLNRMIEEKFDELFTFLNDFKSKIKKNIKEKYKTFVSNNYMT